MCWKATKLHSSPPIRFHSSSLSVRYTACVRLRAARRWGGGAYDKRNVLSISSRGDVLKGTLLLINAWVPTEKGTFCSFAKIKKRDWGGGRERVKKKKKSLLVSILSFSQTLLPACARSYVLNERHIISGQLSYLLFTALWETLVARSTAVTYNISRSDAVPFMCKKKTLITEAGR